MNAEYRFCRALLLGFSQITLHSNALTGLLFLAAIALNSLWMCLAAVGASLVANAAAFLLGARREHLEQGLYGYNAALVGLGCAVYWPLGADLVMIIALAALLSALLMRLLIEPLGAQVFTAPFILSIWLITAFVGVEPVAVEPVSRTGLDNLLLGFGQVLFLDNPLSCLLVLLGIAVASRRALCWGAVAIVLSSGFAFLVGEVEEVVFSGFYAYNAVLVAIALSSRRGSDALTLIAAVLLSVVVTGWLARTGGVVLTAPFVIVCWLVLPLATRLNGQGRTRMPG
ncbi:urea transporter [Marinobacterium lutimaris]|uniref:Urea transporter n=1 Tax=Marinobacterium lutimaris TaxID=568106 RepID=A0A1H6AQH4_9GAMM|nr:urea transporter [Marinobacterium lutimaris]SEG50295.1 urea transporter [Marinobacterium lutimaris]